MSMRLFPAVALLIAVIMTACNVPKEDAHTDLIGQDSLISILSDLYLADATHVNGNISDAADNTGIAAVRAGVLQKQNVSPERFKVTMRYYADHPDELVAVYDKVIEELTRRQSRAPRRAGPFEKAGSSDSLIP
ncbi:MAG: hypothetical protein RL021_1895 [Bacteroidota bacterium]|jgi:hypothetical protein